MGQIYLILLMCPTLSDWCFSSPLCVADVRDPIETMQKFNPESFLLSMFINIAGVIQKEKSDFCEIYAAVHSPVQCTVWS